jgi:hypothetical protein
MGNLSFNRRWTMWLREIMAKMRGTSRRQGEASVLFVRLELEELTPRIVPATNEWIGPAGGVWSIASNWSLGHTPEQTDMLVTGSTPSTDDLPSVSVTTWTNTGSPVTIASGNSVSGQQYISDSGGLMLMPGSTIASDNYIYEYGKLTVMGGAMGMPTVTVSSPNVLLETGSTVIATGGTPMVPALTISGTVEQYGVLDVGSMTSFGTVSIVGAYTINTQATTALFGGSTLSYSGTNPLLDEGVLGMMGATLDLTGNTVKVDGLLDSTAPGDTIMGTAEVDGGTLADDAVFHTLSIAQNLVMQNGTLSLIIGGMASSVVSVGGTVTLGQGGSTPTLEVTAVSPLPSTPPPTTWFLITASGGFTGDFGKFELPPGRTWTHGVVVIMGVPTYFIMS